MTEVIFVTTMIACTVISHIVTKRRLQSKITWLQKYWGNAYTELYDRFEEERRKNICKETITH